MTAGAETEELLAGVRARRPRAIARVMRLIDERAPGARALLKELHRDAGRAAVVGVTGTAGAGKSSLVDRLVQAYRARGESVGVIAVDPSSPYTGGAVLGDRIRMQQHFLDDGVFIRSLATRGHVGGLSRSATDLVRVLDAAGFDRVLVETVGVGQDELEITRLVDTVVVVTAPGLGDDVQAIKAGILEIADVFVVNKADRDGAEATVRDLEQMIALSAPPRPAATHAAAAAEARAPRSAGETGGRWVPPVLPTVATRNEGIDALVAACDAHARFLAATPVGTARRLARETDALRELVRESLLEAVAPTLEPAVRAHAEAVHARREDPFTVAELLVRNLLAGGRA